MRIWQKTDQGVIRKENQDACGVRRCGGYTLAVVCDGMGGARAGAVASSMARDFYLDALEPALEPNMPEEKLSVAALAAVDRANSAVFERSCLEESCRGMGTTLVSAICEGARCLVLNVGDSRAYRINAAGIKAVTRDHSWVQDMLENGDITEEEARNHPNRNLITRALGTEQQVRCDAFSLTLEEGDHILLCSDGLVNTVSDQELLYEVIHEDDMETCLDRLMKIAIDRGAPDNVTIVLLQYEKEAES